jgi:hypothetical protein
MTLTARLSALSALPVGAGLALLPATAGAAEATAEHPVVLETGDLHVPVLGDMELDFSPADELYPRYLANPYRSDFRFIGAHFPASELARASDLRWMVRIGGRYGFFRLHRAGDPTRGMQLSVEAAFNAQFDLKNQLDNIGWDGVYGFHVSWTLPGRLSARLASMHDSSHIGDELGGPEDRINYTREEYVGGLSWRALPPLRLYGEAGYAHHLGSPELMAPWRVEYGLELQSAPFIMGDRVGAYLGADASHFEEDRWVPNVAVQTGLQYPVPELGRSFKIGIEGYQGRSHVGEHFQSRETYIGTGFWFDL